MKAFSAGDHIDPLKLQKLLYSAQGWHLALKDGPLITQEIQAWRFGPVVDDVYQMFRKYGSSPITSVASFMQARDGKIVDAPVNPVPDNDPSAEIIDAVYEQYGKLDGVQLFKMTHADGTAWHKTFTAYDGKLPSFAPIPAEWIRQEFTERLQRSEAA
jgi:uncharacterized phage-associated protein